MSFFCHFTVISYLINQFLPNTSNSSVRLSVISYLISQFAKHSLKYCPLGQVIVFNFTGNSLSGNGSSKQPLSINYGFGPYGFNFVLVLVLKVFLFQISLQYLYFSNVLVFSNKALNQVNQHPLNERHFDLFLYLSSFFYPLTINDEKLIFFF